MAENNNEEVAVELPKLSMPLLVTLRTHQLQNGMRYSDFERYRGYCSRRLHRVRRSVKATHGARRYAKPKVDLAKVSDPRHLLIPLVSAERAWAYAMELRAAQEDAPSRAAVRARMLRRLRKAVKHADELVEVCRMRADRRTTREAEGYASFLKGTLGMEAKAYDSAVGELVGAKSVYTEVLSALEDPEDRRIITDLADELQPSIDYCSFRVQRSGGGTSDSAAAKLKESLAKKNKSGGDAMSGDSSDSATVSAPAADEGMPVTWLGVTLRIRGEKVSECLTSAESILAKVGESISSQKKKAIDMDVVISQFDEVMDKFASALSALRSGNRRLANPHSDAELSALEKYIRAQQTEATILRTRIMYNDTKSKLAAGDPSAHAADMVRICDSFVQYVHDLAALRGIADPGRTPCKETAQILLLKSHRCMFLGQAFADGNQFAEALALVTRASELADEAKAMREEIDGEVADGDSSEAELDAHLESLRALRCVVVARHNIRDDELTKELQDTAEGLSIHDKATRARCPKLLARLKKFETGTTSGDPALIDFPPSVEKVRGKPLFFDLAWNHARYPTRSWDARIRGGGAPTGMPGEEDAQEEGADMDEENYEEEGEEEEEEEEPKKGGGWFGFWK